MKSDSIPNKTKQFIESNPAWLYDKHQLARHLGCHDNPAGRALYALHSEGLLVIDHWYTRGVGGNPTPVFRSSANHPGPDAPRPAIQQRSIERTKLRRARQAPVEQPGCLPTSVPILGLWGM